MPISTVDPMKGQSAGPYGGHPSVIVTRVEGRRDRPRRGGIAMRIQGRALRRGSLGWPCEPYGSGCRRSPPQVDATFDRVSVDLRELVAREAQPVGGGNVVLELLYRAGPNECGGHP